MIKFTKERYFLNKKLTQWHPAFCSALRLELSENKDDLVYHPEYGINTKPIQIDLLVITKTSSVVIHNEIGSIFKGHNIIEYKSPDDELNIDTFFKVIAYASLYKSHGRFVDHIKADDVTISFIRESKPLRLFRQLSDDGMDIEMFSNGIYYIHTTFYFDIQIIVAKELSEDQHIWLSSLTYDISKSKAEKLLNTAADLYRKDDKEFAESVLQVAMSKNKEIFDIVKEESKMCEALRELMKPEIDAEVTKRLDAEVTKRLDAEVTKRLDAEVAKRVDAEVEAKINKITAEKDKEIKALKAKLAAAGIH